jgi:tetratricopeptide (TPR) repeat protein/predicted aspartyl protease
VAHSFAIRMLTGAVLSMVALSGSYAQDCTHSPLAELPMIANDDGTPIVSILIDGKPNDVLLDTGGFWSLISPSFARQYGARRSRIEGRLGLQGIRLNRAVQVPSIQIGSLKIPNVDFFEEPDGYIETAATLGANWLGRMDVEINPVDKKVTFFPSNHCRSEIVDWPHSDLAELPVTVDRGQNLITIPLELDGHEIRALIDTGSPETFLSARAAKQLFGIEGDPSAMETGFDRTGGARNSYRHRFQSLKMGDIVFRDPWVVIAPMVRGDPDMILGMHDLSSLHLYFAYREHKLYASTVRGDNAARRLADRSATPPPAIAPGGQVDLTSARDYLLTAQEALKRRDYDGALTALNNAVQSDPDDVDAYLERGELFTLQGQRDRAFEDLNRAVKLAPKESLGFIERSELYAIAGDTDHALADANHALQLDPGSDAAYAARAEAYAANGAWDRAMQDAGAAIRLGPKSIAGYLTRAHIYELTGDYTHALDDADQAVRLEPKSATALNARCWNGAILSRLDAALDDCNAAVALRPYSAEILDSRAFANLKAGKLDPALADYNAALTVNPRFASSLYGRGLTKQKMGDEAGGKIDIAAARGVDPMIVEHFGK